jgi:cysteinyl-tRNA synthetase
MIRLYNTLTRQKDELRPITKGTLQFFVCGPTVYDVAHIGHGRTYIVYDAFVKYLRSCGLDVFYLQNITDVDDKLINRATEQNTTVKALAEHFETEYMEDMASIGVTAVTEYARATDHIPEIISQVERLLKKGFAYEISDGLYFDIGKFEGYGKLSGRTAEKAQDAVSRVDQNPEKRNNGDFCLWKFSKEGEPVWDSPWGPGRPGWHIEDTAITEKYFGEQYDIHGGGADLVFPHHEAEITQMEAVSGKSPLSNIWMHTGFLTIEKEKMSKSLKNFVTIRDFLKTYSYQTLRMLVLQMGWHSPLDYTEAKAAEAEAATEKIQDFVARLREADGKGSGVQKHLDKAEKDVAVAFEDNFNTPQVLATLFRLMTAINPHLDKNEVSKKEAQATEKLFQDANAILDIVDLDAAGVEEIPDHIKEMVDLREQHRRDNNFEKADEVRKMIEDEGFSVEDTSSGPRVKQL